MTFEDYYKALGFDSYPFSIYNSEGEIDKAESLYHHPSNYSLIKEAISNSSIIIIGERGTGKTALNLDLRRALKDNNTLLVTIDEFSGLSEQYTPEQLYTFLTESIALAFFTHMSSKPTAFWSYNKNERIDLSLYLHKFVRASSKNQLTEKIKSLQNGLLKKIWLKMYNSSRVVLNYGLKAATKAVSDSLTKHFSSLPEFDVGNAEYFQQLESEVDESFTLDQRSFYYLNKLCKLVLKSKISDIVIIMDRIDDDKRFKNDADPISKYIEPIASDNQIMINPLFKLVLFSWSTPFNFIKSNVRTQKLVLQSLSWNNETLQATADKRLKIFSNNKLNSIDSLFEAGCNLAQLFEMSNENPRDLWHLLDKSFKAQFTLDASKKITNEAIMQGIKEFVTTFNYYEYYPRKSNARSNTMDVYSYIKRLLKLDSSEFTKDKLNTLAGTGGSTNNYVTAMENLGLIKNTSIKSQGGGVIYMIKDPKIRYALEHNLIIEVQ